MMKNSIASLAALSLALAGCAPFGPDRSPPPVAAPDHYTAEPVPAAAGGKTPAEWWNAYGCAALDEQVAEGLANSPSLATAQHRLEAARHELEGQIGETLLPRVDAGFNATRQNGLSLPGAPKQTMQYDVFSGGVQGSYSFDFFGAAYMSDRALAGQVQQQEWYFDAMKRALAANIVKAAITVASLAEQVDSAERMVDLAEQEARLIAARNQAGSASRDEMLAAAQGAASGGAPR
jgi:outer membrane protein TolC